MTSRSLVFHPGSVLIFSLLGALLYAVWITWRFPGGDLSHHYVYVVPIVVPFVAFLFDRAQSYLRERVALMIGRQTAGAGGRGRPSAHAGGSDYSLVIDALVVGVSLLRMAGKVPAVSGHALFLIYAILRPGSRVTRITAGVVMLEVIYLKFFVWHDLISPVTGTALAVAAALMIRRYERTNRAGRGN